MNKFLITIFGAVFWGAGAMAEPVEGIWQTAPGQSGNYAHVDIKPCGANFCDYILRTYTAEGQVDSDLIGQMVVRNMASMGNNSYEGKVWRPSNDKVYTGKATVSGDTIDLSGCIVGGLICRSVAWHRVK